MAAGSPRSNINAAARISTTQPGPVKQMGAIANLTAITGGEAPTEAEHNLIITKVNALLAALRTSGALAS